MVISIAFMFLCVLALLPFMAFAIGLILAGDRLRELEADARIAARVEQAIPALETPNTITPIHARPHAAGTHAVVA